MKKISFVLFMLIAVTAYAEVKLLPHSYVTDYAGVLTADKQFLEHRISEYHKKTGIEIAVVTVTDMGGVSVEQFANTLFHQWGIGQKGKNNGILLLLAMKEHKIRIEVGYGLEGQLNDGFCGQVIRERMTPAFKQKQFGQGFQNALDAIMQRIGN